MGFDLFFSLITSLALTLLLESCYAKLHGINGRDFCLVVLVNILTNPVVVFCRWMTRLWLVELVIPVTIALELWAAGTEGWLYRSRSGIAHPWRFVVGANLLSYMVGRLL